MLLCKWCLFLMRMMSPPVVGLIWFSLIGVSSLSLHSQNLQENVPTVPTKVATVKPQKDFIHPVFAKHRPYHKTKLAVSEETSIVRKTPNFTKTSFGISSGDSSNKRNKTIPNLNLNLRLKVGNINQANSTIIFLPRLSRSMVNDSKNSVHNALQPIIVSSVRQDLLQPNQYKVRIAPNTKSRLKSNSSSRLESHSLNSSTKFPTPNDGLKTRKPSSFNYNRTRSFQKVSNLFKDDMPKNRMVSESTAPVLIKFRSRPKNGTHSKKFPVIEALPTRKPISQYGRRTRQKQNRTGRNFDLNESPKSTEFQPINSEMVTLISILNETNSSNNNFRIRKISELRDQLINYANSPLLAEFNSSSLIPTSDLGSRYFEKKAKNLTIYEILKPRLRTELLVIINNTLNNSTNQSLTSGISSTILSEIIENSGGMLNDSSSMNDIPGTEENNNATFVTNGIDYGVTEFEKTPVIMPGRSDSSYAIEFVTVNRNNSVVVSAEERNKTNLNITLEYTPGDSRSEIILNERPITEIKSEIDANSNNMQNMGQGINVTAQGVISNLSEIEKQTDASENHSLENKVLAASNNSNEENLSADGSEYMTTLYESDSIRRAKMSESINSNNTPFKNPKIDSKMFYDYFAKKPLENITIQGFPYQEFRPGNMFRYSDIYHRKPILDAYTRPNLVSRLVKTEETAVTEETVAMTTFNSLRTTFKVASTFYPNRMQDGTMKFGNRLETTTLLTVPINDKKPENQNDEDPDDAEYRDAIDPGFTMEKLAYLLIGTCCGLSILCLFVVVVAIKCRRAIVEKRLKAQFRKRLYQHERIKDMATPWQQQMFDHFMYLHRRPGDSSCSSVTDNCNCRCVTWSLGARNLDASRPLCPVNRGSLYLCGQKRLPFGAASTLRYESMLGRKRPSPEANHQKRDSPNSDSSHENDSLDIDSDSREGDGPKQCTCIDYNVWPMPPPNVPRGFFTLCPNPGRYNMGNCSQHPPAELRTITRDIPPPVTGSNYLDRSEGVVYWSSNEERLI